MDLFQRQLPRCECTYCGGLKCLTRDALLFDCISAAASLPHRRRVDGHRHNCIIIMSIITLFIITMHYDMLDNNNKNENGKKERKEKKEKKMNITERFFTRIHDPPPPRPPPHTHTPHPHPRKKNTTICSFFQGSQNSMDSCLGGKTTTKPLFSDFTL